MFHLFQSTALLAVIACCAYAGFEDQTKVCGGNENALKYLDIQGCESLDDGVCKTKHMANIVQITKFAGEAGDYEVKVLGRQGDKSLAITADPSRFHTECTNGLCTLTHKYIIAPNFETGESIINYTIERTDGSSPFFCYQYGIDIASQ